MKNVSSEHFKSYGKKLSGFSFETFVNLLEEKAPIAIPTSGNEYSASVPTIEATELFTWLQYNVYGGLPIQIGTCAGHNQNIIAVEYHQGSEVVVALTDCKLMVGHTYDMQNLSYDASLMESFLLKKGEAVELYSTTLHYSPNELDENGYATLVALLKETNEALNQPSSNPLLLSKNKFMIVHESRKDKIAGGAHPGFINKTI